MGENSAARLSPALCSVVDFWNTKEGCACVFGSDVCDIDAGTGLSVGATDVSDIRGNLKGDGEPNSGCVLVPSVIPL